MNRKKNYAVYEILAKYFDTEEPKHELVSTTSFYNAYVYFELKVPQENLREVTITMIDKNPELIQK